jgi:hypothetical protein
MTEQDQQHSPVPWSPIPEEATLQWGPHEISILRYEGREYINMSNAWKYLGKSKPQGDRIILEEAEEGRITRYQIGARDVYVLREDLEKLRKKVNDPVPLPPPTKRKGSRSKAPEEV